MGRDTPGDFEKLVMLAVLHLEDDAYGAEIVRELEERTGRDVSSGAVYVALRRLEEKGMARSRTGEPTPERGGRAKRFYRLRAEGVEALREARQEWEAMTTGLEDVLAGEGA